MTPPSRLPGTVVTRFFQVENKLDAIVRLLSSAEIPLVQMPG